MLGVSSVDPSFRYWNDLTSPSDFLADDDANPARDYVVEVLKREVDAGARWLVEVGPGAGRDYRRYRHLPLDVLLVEGSAKLADYLRKTCPTAHVRNGTFSSLMPGTADISYCKAVLEHQPDFRDPLRQLIRAARRLCIVNWYRPPAEAEERTYNARDEVHYNTYRRSDVLALVADEGRAVETATVGWNEVWLIREKNAAS